MAQRVPFGGPHRRGVNTSGPGRRSDGVAPRPGMRPRRRGRGRSGGRPFRVTRRTRRNATMQLTDTLVETVPTGLEERLRTAAARARACLLSKQKHDGHWLGELGADTTLESDYIFYLFVLRDTARVHKLAERIRNRQLPDGGWNIYEGGPSELNATVKAYFALKLAGDAAVAPHMVRARRSVLHLGGLERTNSYARFYLALAGVVSWDMVAAMPPELMLLPRWLPLNIYEMSSWTRAMVVPLTILYARRFTWSAPACPKVDELFCGASRSAVAFEHDRRWFTWRN